MTASRPKALTWRVTEIPAGTTDDELLSYFDPNDQGRLTVCSLCPDVDGNDTLTATVLFRPHPEQPDLGPQFNFRRPPAMEIDKDFEGFTPLYCPPKGTHIEADIIAITGLAGHAFGSWAHSEERMWLRDYLPKAFAPRARILTYGYRSRITGENQSLATLADLSSGFSENLIDMRDKTECDQRPIIFIGHSLGCMLIKKSMTSVRYRNVDSSRFPVRALIFLAAPHRGMNIDALRTVVKNEPPKHLIEELAPESPTLKEMNEAFMEIAKDIDILTCYETESTRTLAWDASKNTWTRSGEPIQMLHQFSATQYWPKEKAIPANANHSTIAKLKKGGGSILGNVGMAIKRALVPTAQNFFANPQSTVTGIMEWKAPHKTSMPHLEAPLQPEPRAREPKTPQRPHRLEQIESDKPSQLSSPHSSTYGQPPNTPSTPPYTREPPTLQSGRDEVKTNNTDLNVPNGSPYARSSTQSLRSPPWNFENAMGARSHSSPARQLPEIQDPSRQDAPPQQSENAAQFGSNSPWAPQANQNQHGLTVPPPYNHRAVSEPFPMSHASGGLGFPPGHFNNRHSYGPQHSGPEHGPGIMETKSEQMRQEFEQIGLGPDVTTQTSQPTIQQQNALAGRHPDIYCDECSREIVGLRFKCLGCPDWNYCSHCFRTAIGSHPRHEFRQMDPPDLNSADDPDAEGEEQSRDEPEERLGSANCAYCGADVVSPTLFYQCSQCPGLELACQRCQGDSLVCLDHGERIQLRQFIWYGEYLASNVWINDEPSPEDSTLVQALKSRDMNSLDRLARMQQLVNAVDHAGRTPLHIAAHLQLDVGAKFLLMHGANSEIRDENSRTPLNQAIMSKNEAMAMHFLARGANPNSLDNAGNTPLHLASITGCIELARMLLYHFAAQVDRKNKLGHTALYCACLYGNYRIARFLLEARADPNMTNDNGNTQLGDLVASNRIQAVRFLLESGADAESVDAFSRTALYRAAENGHSTICFGLMQWDADPNVVVNEGESTPLGEAAANGHIDAVRVLLQGGANIEGMDSRERTPLFRAAAEYESHVCRVLLDFGANPNPGLALPVDEECQWLMTPLHIATFFDFHGIVDALIEYDVDLEEVDQFGRTALFLAADLGRFDVCKFLLEAGANREVLAGGSSVLSIAAQRGHLEVVQLLLEGPQGAIAIPPPGVKGRKWKNFVFDTGVLSGRKQDILEVLRARKHGRA